MPKASKGTTAPKRKSAAGSRQELQAPQISGVDQQGVWARASEAQLRAKVSGADGGTLYLWSYRITVANDSKNAVILVAREWKILDRDSNGLVVTETYAPSVNAQVPVIQPGKSYTYEGGVATSSEAPGGMSGRLWGFDHGSRQAIAVSITPFGFGQATDTAPTISVKEKLGTEDAARLRRFVDAYNEGHAKGDPVLLRIDEIPLSPKGAALVNSFLIDHEHRVEGKSTQFDFSSILPSTYTVKIDGSDDHYFLPTQKSNESNGGMYFGFAVGYRIPFMPPRIPSLGAALEDDVTKLIRDYGFGNVLLEVAGRVPTSVSAPKVGTDTVAPSTSEVEALLNKEKVPAASRDSVKLAIMVPILKATRPKWRERLRRGELATYNAPTYLRKVLPEMVGTDGTVYKDLVRQIDKELTAALDAYVSSREGRGSEDLGDAEGLKFVLARPALKKRNLQRPALPG